MKVKFAALASALALGAVLVCGVSLVGVTPAFAAPSHALKRDVALKLQAAQTDIKKGAYADALAKLKAAEAMPAKDQTPYSRHVTNQLYVFAYEKTHEYAKLAPKLQALLSDEYITPAERAQFTSVLAQIYYQLRQYPKAIEYGTTAIEKHYAGAQMATLVGQSYYLQGDWKGTIKFEKGLIDAAIKRGAKPSKQSLQLVESSCQKMHDDSCLLGALEQLVVYYPTRGDWQYLVFTAFKTIKNDRNLLQAYRLAFNVGVMQQPHEFTDYAELAIEANDPGEAETVLNSALKNNVFSDPHAKAKAQRILADAKRKAAKDLDGGLASTQAAAARQSTGNSDVRVGLAYYGYEQYDKAISAYTQGIAKGGLSNPAEAHLLLGIAELKAGHKGAALKAFGGVKGDPALKRLAALWSLKARSAA